MKKKNYFLFVLSVAALFSTILISCSKDEEESKPYVGEWESTEYTNLSGATEKMEITLTNTTFEDHIFQGTPGSLNEATAVKGTVNYIEEGKLNIDITDISVLGTAFVNKESDSVTFYGRWNVSVGQILDINFDASYTLTNENNSMTFVIPLKIGGSLPVSLTRK